jgi:hypothetical protein
MRNHNSKLKIHHSKFVVSAFFSTTVERALQKNFFLQNKAKLTQFGQFGQFPPLFLRQKSISNSTCSEKRSQTNPIQTQNEANFLAFPLTIYDLLVMMYKPKFGQSRQVEVLGSIAKLCEKLILCMITEYHLGWVVSGD